MRWCINCYIFPKYWKYHTVFRSVFGFDVRVCVAMSYLHEKTLPGGSTYNPFCNCAHYYFYFWSSQPHRSVLRLTLKLNRVQKLCKN
ncbi:hypothetical protein NECAME_14024 [Necator americanus]|uniref:Uncharacterized protein n=1 Tax=Necator americanus TaxID=51031 RepID=W2SQH3_NECAM|nr:hypothetical protein NECAME_14024 [Necator americanus]ETN71979.1 hypothetical protein NECAME_14024 [Necator americanus]